ncbi:protein mono-ADP-ribosyltransferase PARP14-like [Branchiostoma floridae]|uniref:Poly [ADP-ribose] polymerase n=1 Tax=Branchiostoma floridae TaxID=7739 RepID=A0A9J7L235_BRAFL|nr:protein mono-ADP-ribosyltransferase PARP14-like [Branchiostoma floridae]
MSGEERSVLVRGLPDLPGLQDKVTIYFQSRSQSSGGDVRTVRLLGPGRAVVTFEDQSVAQNVLAQPGHYIQGSRVKVVPCPGDLEEPEMESDAEECDSVDHHANASFPSEMSFLGKKFEEVITSSLVSPSKKLKVDSNEVSSQGHSAGSASGGNVCRPRIPAHPMFSTPKESPLNRKMEEERATPSSSSLLPSKSSLQMEVVSTDVASAGPKWPEAPSASTSKEDTNYTDNVMTDGAAPDDMLLEDHPVLDMGDGSVRPKETGQHNTPFAKETTEEGLYPAEDVVLQVSGFSPDQSQTVEMYFENSKRSGGGEMKSFEIREDKAFIVFSDPAASERVLAREHKIGQATFLVKAVRSNMAANARERPLHSTCLLVKGINESTSRETLLLYMEAISGDTVVDIVYSSQPGLALVTMDRITDFDRMVAKSAVKQLEGRSLTVERVPITDGIIVTGLPDNTPKDLVELYFDNANRSGGGPIADVKYDQTRGTAIIHFESPDTVNTVLQQEHKLNNTVITVKPYYECLGETLEDHDPAALKLPDPVEVEVNAEVMNFISSTETYINELTKTMEDIYATVDWNPSLGRVAVLTPTMTPALKDVHKVTQDWAQRSKNFLEEYLRKFQAVQFSVSPDIWEHAKDEVQKIVENISREAVWVDGYEKEEGGGSVQIIGTVEAVAEARHCYKAMVDKVEAHLKREASIVTDHIRNIMAARLKLLNMHNFPSKHSDIEMQLHIDRQEVFFRGQQSLVTNAKIKVYEFFNSLVEERINLSRGIREYLMSNKGRGYVENSMQEKGIMATCSTDNGEVMVLAVDPQDIQSAKHILQQSISETKITVPDDSEDLLDTRGWADHIGHLKDTLAVDIHANTSGSVWVVGPSEIVPLAQGEVNSYIVNNTIVKIDMNVGEGCMKFLQDYHRSAISGIERKLMDHKVKITQTGKGFLIHGTKEGTQAAKAELQDLVSAVLIETMAVTKPGLYKFFTGNIGKGLLKVIEREEKVVISTEDIPAGAAASGVGRPVSAPKQLCCVTTRQGKKLFVCQGDLTALQVDVIVNAANSRLSHVGGLAAALVKAGGKEIQRDCESYIRTSGQLSDGDVMTTKPYRLPCKMVVHAVGPQWKSGLSEDEKGGKEANLYRATFSSLQEAKDFHSIGIPAISSGVYGFPIDLCVSAILEGVMSFFNIHPNCKLSEVYFTEMDAKKTGAFKAEMVKRFGADNVKLSNWSESISSGAAAVPGPSGVGRERVSTHGQPASSSTGHGDSIRTAEGLTLQLKQGGITAEQADVLVNTVGTDLDLGQGGVASAFLKAGGPELQQFCSAHGKAKPGDVVPTPSAGGLLCQQVYHAVISWWQNTDTPLRTIIQTCLTMAHKNGLPSIAFPALGTGNLGYPRSVAASAMFDEVINFSQANPRTSLKHVSIVVYDQPTVQAFQEELRTRQGLPGTARLAGAAAATGNPSTTGFYSAVTSPQPNQQQMTIGNVTLQVQQGDITTESVDAIIVPTNNKLRLDAGVAQVVSRKAGGSLQAECLAVVQQYGELQNGAVATTGAGSLPCRHVLHLANPQPNHLKDNIKHCLQTADQKKLKSVALPAIGTGGINISPDQSAKGMLDGIAEFVQQSNPQNLALVRITIFQPQMLQTFHTEMDNRAKSLSGKLTGLGSRVIEKVKKVARNVLGLKPSTKKVASALGFASWDGTADPTLSSPSSESSERTGDLQLNFFGADQRSIDSAKRKVEGLVEEKSKNEVIENAAVAQLTQEEIKLLVAYGRQRNVNVTVEQGARHRICIQGASDMTSVISKVWEVLNIKIEEGRKFESALFLQKDVQWHYEKPDGSYQEFEPLVNAEIEEAFQAKRPKVQYEEEGEKYEIDFQSKQERNLSTGAITKVRRDDMRADTGAGMPAGWDPQPTDPRTGTPQLCHLVTLVLNSAEYNTVTSKLLPTTLNIQKIERVQNPTLWKQYCVQREKICQKNPTRQNEQELWHGSLAESCVKISHHGFNRSYAGMNATAFGKGTYFARDPSYSVRGYARPDANGLKRLFLAKVITGEYIRGNSNMIVPPSRPGGNPLDTYDSTVDNVNNPSIFCVYHDAQAYPEYLLTFI